MSPDQTLAVGRLRALLLDAPGPAGVTERFPLGPYGQVDEPAAALVAFLADLRAVLHIVDPQDARPRRPPSPWAMTVGEIIRRADRERLPMMVLYDRQPDDPGRYVAQLWYSLPEPEAAPTILRDPSLDSLREAFAQAGFTCLARNEDDDPSVIESWIL